MIEIILSFLISLILTVAATPLTIRFANKLGLVNDPSKRPHPAHIQDRIVPRAGGLPIYLAILTTSLIFLPLEKHLVGIFVGITLLLIMGLLDDKLTNFSPYIRLLLLFLAALAAVGSGIGITFITNPLYGFPNFGSLSFDPIIHLDSLILPFDFLGRHNIVVIADLLALIWIVALTQVINWSKGVDGQMPGITLVTTLTLGIFSYQLFLQGDPNQLNLAKLAFIVAGSSLGFLVFNWHPAKIFPGFSGSTILAFMIAVLAILSGAKLATAALVLAVPIIDFGYTIIRRIAAGKSPVWGDRGHLHHRLLDMGWSHQSIALFYIAGSAILGAVALNVATTSKLFAVGLVALAFFGFVLWLNSFGVYSKRSDPGNG